MGLQPEPVRIDGIFNAQERVLECCPAKSGNCPHDGLRLERFSDGAQQRETTHRGSIDKATAAIVIFAFARQAFSIRRRDRQGCQVIGNLLGKEVFRKKMPKRLVETRSALKARDKTCCNFSRRQGHGSASEETVGGLQPTSATDTTACQTAD